MGVRLEWNGDKLSRKVRDATVSAVDETNEAAAERARSDHGWQSVTGTAERSIQAMQAEVTRGGVKGSFGSYGPDAFYFVFLEAGSANTAPDDTLRRASDAENSGLAGRIRSNL